MGRHRLQVSLPECRANKKRQSLMVGSFRLNLSGLAYTMPSKLTEQRMRVLLILIAVTFSGGCASQNFNHPVTDDTVDGKPPILVITSPRHARTFDVTGNDKLSQDLRWNPDTQTLSAFVTYSMVSGGGDDEMDPANYRVIELPFPEIKLDEAGNLFVLDNRNRKVSIGRLGSGIFGSKVVLNDNVRLSAHRQDKMLSGKLIVSVQ